MSDDISGGTEDVVGVLTQQIETHFGMGFDGLKAAVDAAPAAHPAATVVVKWHRLLRESQTALDQAEDDLLAALESQPSEVDDPTLDLAKHRVDAAVTARDGRAMVIRWLLDPHASGQQDATERLARTRGRRQGPAVPTSAPPRPATAPQAGKGVLR
ncbi:hypothetical protein ACF06Q_08435 [Streptomyces leeuwenhoekii]|uniref:hypothetical protein n=1 Tax=Streptomyces leeuwenhoekii TaxID=1437453 RepID=UPI0036FABBC1